MKKWFILFAMVFGIQSLFGQGTINGAGATFPYPVYAAWAYEYQKATKIKLNYQSIGSGGGVRQISQRTVDFGASDAPLTPERLAKEELLQFPAIIGGVVPIVNIPGIKSGQLKLTQEALGKIFAGEIEYWDDPAIKSVNQDLNLPHKKITSVHRSDGSGTTAIFTKYLAVVYPEFEKKVGVGKSVKWVGGIGAKGNEGVANYVKRVKYSIGYVEFAYAKQNKLPYALLRNKEGNFVAPDFSTFKAAAANAEWNLDEHFYLWLVDEPGKDSWPITGASFILLAKEKPESNKRVVKFYDWCFKNGDKTAERLTYVPLPEKLKNLIREYWKKYGIY
ncbi:MAG: phosphate ABC transporter substrate-binding protein PstS [Calditrichaeota bacterium]|nr:MAG: phosphate ABC transporter substrate-binding protein PstS [Calditrichota bacterium]